ncbi:MAG: formate/nitrite transporter family protein [Opitutales bacterium]|nr:formate/nitrite transporter family protein [Opitutales bacterium]
MKNFISAIYAGLMIAFGGAVYVSSDNKYMGSFMFSLGLLTVVLRGFDLYTGKIGYLTISKTENSQFNILKSPFYYPIIILGNFAGAWLLGTAMRCTRFAGAIVHKTEALSAAKLADKPLSIFILSMACGIMMFLAVDGYKKSKNWLFVILPVMVFIISGFEHSIANMFYFSAANAWDMKTLWYEIIMILGNGVGAIAFCACEKLKQ